MRKYSSNRKYRTAYSKHPLPEKYTHLKKQQDINTVYNNIFNFFGTFVKKIINKNN